MEGAQPRNLNSTGLQVSFMLLCLGKMGVCMMLCDTFGPDVSRTRGIGFHENRGLLRKNEDRAVTRGWVESGTGCRLVVVMERG